MRKYGELTLGQIEAVVNKLGGMDGVDRLLRDEPAISAPQLRTPFSGIFSVWKTLTVRSYKSVEDIRSTLTAANMCLSDWAADAFSSNVTLSAEVEMVEFVRVKVSDLGFTKATKLRDILEAGKQKGLKLCLPTDGLAIRLGYPDQPMNETVWLAMEPIKDWSGYWGVLSVGRDEDGLWLDTDYNDLGGVWNPEREFFFRK